MKAQLSTYLTSNPLSSLNVFRDLYAAELERKAGLELQKFAINFNTLTEEQKMLFFIELDKALTNINIMRGIVADINKEVQAEAASELATMDLEKLKKEEEEKQKSKELESLSVAIERAALKTSAAVNTGFIPGLDSIATIDALNKNFTQATKVLDEQLIKVTELLLSKVKVVEDADSKLGNTGYMDEDGNISKTSILVNVIRLQSNAIFLAQELGIRPRDMDQLIVIGDRVVVKGMEDKFLPFSTIKDLFDASAKENAANISPIMLSSVEGIKLALEKARESNKYLDEKTKHLEQGIAQSTEWRVKVLQDRGIVINMSDIDKQLDDISRNAPKSFVAQITIERAARELLTKDLEETKATQKQKQATPEVQRVNVLAELTQLREFSKDGSSVMLKMYKNHKKTKFTEDIPKNPGITPEEINEPRRGHGKGVLGRPSL